MLDARKTLVNTRTIVLCVAALILVLPARACAHDIPNDVTGNAFLRPDGQRLHVLIRVPLKAMREGDAPRQRAGFLDLPRAHAALRNAATRWTAHNVDPCRTHGLTGTPR